MEIIRKQKPPVLIGIGLAVVLVVAGLLYMVAFRGPAWTTVATSPSEDQANAWQWKLDDDKVKARVKTSGGRYEVQVFGKADSVDGTSLKGSNFLDRAKADSTKDCTPPGQFANRAQTQAYESCKTERKIYDRVASSPGVLEAQVNVTAEDSGAFTGSDTITSLSVRLFLDPDAAQPVDAAAMATEIAAMVEGGAPDRVVISDSTGKLLWNKGQGEAAQAKNAAGGCNLNPSTPITDITAKEQAVKTCIEEDVRKKVAALVGDEERVQVAAGVTLSPAAENKTAREVTRGALLEQNTISSSATGGSNVNDSKNFSPNTTETNTQKNAGYLQRLSLSVTLDSRYVTPAMETTVRNFLRGMVDPRRGDPIPSVQSTRFAGEDEAGAGGAKGAPDAKVDAGAAGAGGAKDGAKEEAMAPAAAGLPKGVLVVGLLLIVGLVTTIALLWRRSARLASERRAFEEEFRHEARMFDSFAQNNPDELARQLEAWLGAPPQSPAPTH